MGFLGIFFKLILSVLCGGIIGWERERYHKPAGFRTHTLVCMGSALFMMVSIYISSKYSQSDPARIAAQVVTGIGFIGAGTIWMSRGSVKGLTTAATLWSTAGVGLAIGCGFYSGAIIASVFILIVLLAFPYMEKTKEIDRKE